MSIFSCVSLTNLEGISTNFDRSHGKFRPSLKAYVQQNADSFCKEQTTDAFKTVAGASKDAKKIQEALKILTKLKGIGPATASLLLSCFEPAVVPFFSDELFRWSVFEDSKARGWGREIKYTMKEYLQLFDKVQEFITRLVVEYSQQISVVEIEKVAYVLGKRAAGGAPSAAGNKRKAETEPKDELRGDLSTSAQSVPLPTKASDGVKMKKAEEKQTERPKAEGVEPEPSTRAKRAKTKKKTTTDVTAAASRPRCNAS